MSNITEEERRRNEQIVQQIASSVNNLVEQRFSETAAKFSEQLGRRRSFIIFKKEIGISDAIAIASMLVLAWYGYRTQSGLVKSVADIQQDQKNLDTKIQTVATTITQTMNKNREDVIRLQQRFDDKQVTK